MSGHNRTVAFAQRALADLEDIAAVGLARWGAEQANDYLHQIESTIATLTNYPQLGVAREDLERGVRALPVGQHRIFYIATPDQILIVRVVHHRVDIQL
jgi:toxin ParE1/3/4